MSVWSPGSPGVQERPLPRYEEPASADVLWFNIDPPVMPAPREPRTGSEEAAPQMAALIITT